MHKTKKKPEQNQELPTTQEGAERVTNALSSSVMADVTRTIRRFEDKWAKELLRAKTNEEFDRALYKMDQDKKLTCPYITLDNSVVVNQDEIKKSKKDGMYELPNMDWESTEQAIRDVLGPAIDEMIDGAAYLEDEKKGGKPDAFAEVTVYGLAGPETKEFNERLASVLVERFGERLAKRGINITLGAKREGEEANPKIEMRLVEEQPRISEFSGKPLKK